MKTSIFRLLALNLALILLLSLVFPAFAVETEDSSNVITDPVGSYTAGTYIMSVPKTTYFLSNQRLRIYTQDMMEYNRPKIVVDGQNSRYIFRLEESVTYKVFADADFTLQEQSLPIPVYMEETEFRVSSDEAAFTPEKDGYYFFSTVTHLDLSLYDESKCLGDISSYLAEPKRDFYVHLLADTPYHVSAYGIGKIEMVSDPIELLPGTYETDGLYTSAESGWYSLEGCSKIYDITGKAIEQKLGFYHLNAEKVYYIDIAPEGLTVESRPAVQTLILDRDLEPGYYSFRATKTGLYTLAGSGFAVDKGRCVSKTEDASIYYWKAGQEVSVYSTVSFGASYFGEHYYQDAGNGTISYKGYYGTDLVLKIPAQINGMKVTEVYEDFRPNAPTYGSRVELPEGIETLHDHVVSHGNNAVIDIVLPETLKTIESDAFASSLDLVLTIPQFVEEIHPRAASSAEGMIFKHVFYGGTEEQWQKLTANAPNFPKEIETLHTNAGKDDYVVEYQADGVVTVFCKICNDYIRGVCKDHGVGVFVPSEGESLSCDALCKGSVQCKQCRKVLDSNISMIPVAHCLSKTPLDDEMHAVTCDYCDYLIYEPHEAGEDPCSCAQTADSIPVDESIRFLHSMNLTSDIGIHFVLPRQQLQDYHPESLYVEISTVNQEGDTVVTKLLPEYRDGSYYFTYDKMNAVTIGDVVEATFYGRKDGKTYRSNVDEYSVAEYAYSQLSKSNASAKLKSLCANLLQYGAAAQTYKNHHTDALVNAAMTTEHKSYLTALEEISFGEGDEIISELEGATVSWAGKSLLLDSTITLRYVVDLSSFTGDPNNLTLTAAYIDMDGVEQWRNINGAVPYDIERNLYCFDIDSLFAAEMRTMVNLTIYEVERPVSHTKLSCAASYGNGKDGTLLTLCQALMAYSDAAYAYFRG